MHCITPELERLEELQARMQNVKPKKGKDKRMTDFYVRSLCLKMCKMDQVLFVLYDHFSFIDVKLTIVCNV